MGDKSSIILISVVLIHGSTALNLTHLFLLLLFGCDRIHIKMIEIDVHLQLSFNIFLGYPNMFPQHKDQIQKMALLTASIENLPLHHYLFHHIQWYNLYSTGNYQSPKVGNLRCVAQWENPLGH